MNTGASIYHYILEGHNLSSRSNSCGNQGKEGDRRAVVVVSRRREQGIRFLFATC